MAGNGGGLRMTRARSEILAELTRARNHPTAAELYGAVRCTLPAVSLATVYRALEALAREGRVRVVEEVAGPRRFDASPAEHYHVVCESCGRIEDVTLGLREPLVKVVADGRGFDIRGHRLCFTGLCPSCRKRTRATRRKAPATGRREA